MGTIWGFTPGSICARFVAANYVLARKYVTRSTPVEKAARDKILHKIPYGLYIVAAHSDGGVSAIIANWVTQVSFNPPMIGIAIESDSDIKHKIGQAKYFSLNFLPAGSSYLAKPFLKKSKHVGNTINRMGFVTSKHGTPFFNDAVDCIECSVVDSLPTGDHIFFVGEILDGMSRGEQEILSLKETGWKYTR